MVWSRWMPDTDPDERQVGFEECRRANVKVARDAATRQDVPAFA